MILLRILGKLEEPNDNLKIVLISLLALSIGPLEIL